MLLVRLLETADWARNRALLSRVCATFVPTTALVHLTGMAQISKNSPFAAIF
jgi:hypothetical protein